MKKKKIIIGVILGLIILTVSGGVFALRMALKKNKNQQEAVEWNDISKNEESSTSEETSEIESTETQESEPEKVNYPEPEYDFKTDEVVVEIPGLEREYTIAWVSDLQMITDHKAADDIKDEDLDTIEMRYELFKTDDGVYADELLSQVIDYLNYGDFDGIVFGGDMLDYCSQSNMETLKTQMERLDKSIPLLYIRADHDYGFWYGGDEFTETDAENMHKEMEDGDDLNEKYLDFGEFVIIGINRSTKDMQPNQYSIVSDMFSKAESESKPVIVATHVPYGSKVDDTNKVSLYDYSMQVKNKIYYWGGGDYVPNDVTSAFLDNVYKDDTNVVQVLAGHFHAGWDGKITDKVNEHIFEPAYLGNIGIIKVVPKGKSE